MIDLEQVKGMEEAKTQNGLIGFFDILGYQSFLENNDAETAALEVLDIINNIGTIVSSGLIASLRDPNEKQKKMVESIQWLVFSDTILMAMEWNESLHDFVGFGIAAIRLCREMFDFGLPLRGAIGSGRYLINESCFAGRVIVDAYRAEKNINLAACVLDQKLIDMLMGRGEDAAELVERIVVRYMTPLIDGQYQKRYLLHYLSRHGRLPHPNAVDIPQLVLNSFWAHGKDITASAETKARNTESFLRFLFHRFPDDFASTLDPRPRDIVGMD